MLTFIVDRFGDIDTKPNADVEANVGRLLGWLVVLGFADQVEAKLDANTLVCRVVAPANLWSLKALGKAEVNCSFITQRA